MDGEKTAKFNKFLAVDTASSHLFAGAVHLHWCADYFYRCRLPCEMDEPENPVTGFPVSVQNHIFATDSFRHFCHVDLDVFNKFRGIRAVLLNFKQRLKPGGRSLLNFRGTRPVIIEKPVRENAVLGDPVHFLCPDLILDRRAVRTDHRRVKTLISVRLRHRDKVLEALRHRLIHRMQGAESEVALLRGA